MRTEGLHERQCEEGAKAKDRSEMLERKRKAAEIRKRILKNDGKREDRGREAMLVW